MPGISITAPLTSVSAQMKLIDKKFAAATRKNLRAAIKAEGESVVQAVRGRASWSSRIPAATDLSIRFNPKGASVWVVVNHRKAPHARPLELGNKNSFPSVVKVAANGRKVAVRRADYNKAIQAGGGVAVLRHPVFHKIGEPGGFADQPTRPFFGPAVAAAAPGIDRAMEGVVIQTAHDAGFK